MAETEKCLWCGKEFVKGHGKRYCSKTCSHKAYGKRARTRRKAEMEKQPKEWRVCRICGCSFQVPPDSHRTLCGHKHKDPQVSRMEQVLQKRRDISGISQRARESGMSYGQYVAMQYAKNTQGGRR